jgi:hypothetical protein
MALTQDERISISKKIVQIPLQNAASDTISAQIGEQKAKAQKEDDANKTLQDDVTSLINGYQLEMARADGNGRNELLEQDMIDGANRKLQNFFFPNDPQTPTPSIPDGVWKYFIPFAYNKAIGKSYLETYSIVTKESDLITAVSNAIAVVESFSNITRSTGQSCNAGGTCSLPLYTTQATCENATPTPGVWTPSGSDIIDNDPAMQAAGTALINAIQAWEDFINGTFAIVVTTDTDPTRSAQNIASKADITNSLSVINAWQALTTYNTAHGQTTCSGFNSYNVNLLGPVKFRAAELNLIKDEIVARTSFVATRIGELSANLGTVVQNMADGSLTTATGFYGRRMRIINTRLNAMGGSLTKLKGLERGQDAQEQAKDSNDNTAQVYQSVMTCSAFRAPSTGNATIHLLDGSGFSAGNTVYVCAENQEEIQTTILSVSGNTVFLADKIPQKYRQNEFARLYKVL